MLAHCKADLTPNDLTDNPKLARYDYDVRADGKRTGVTETHWLDSDSDGTAEPHVTRIDWAYDALGRLTSESIDHFDNAFDQAEYFTYDLVGSRRTRQLDKNFDGTIDEAIAYLYDANDRLLSEEKDGDNDGVVDETTTYAYDGPLSGTGDATQVTAKTVFDNSTSQTVSQTAYTYDLQGRLLTSTITSHTSGTASRIERTTYNYVSVR